jgi:hypothetical protein
MESELNKITKMYDKLTYFDQYGGSFILFIIITIVIIISITYFHTMINVQPIIDDWVNQRCKPTIIPIAGFINHPEGVSATEYTAQNFTYCTQNILSSITGSAVEPLTYVTNVLQSIANVIQEAIQSIRAMFDKIRTSMQSVSEEIMGRLMNVMIPLQQIIISFKDLIGKIQGTMTAGLFTLLGSYYTLKSLLGAIAQFIIIILITLAAMIAAFWILPFTWPLAISNTVIFIAIAIPLVIILAFMTETLHINAGLSIPSVKCFDKDTLINMNDGTQKKIINIEVGDVLMDNNIVTAKIKVLTEGSKMYSLNKIIVSDSHIVKLDDKWIPVSKHPNAIPLKKYDEGYLYCLNTSNKFIKINGITFTDWDEIYGKNLNKIINNDIKEKKLIHKYLDRGFHSSTKIKLFNGELIDIIDVKPNFILQDGEKVYGIVEINGSDLDENFVYNLGKNNNVEGFIPYLNVEKEKIKSNQKLYHLLTDTNSFRIGEYLMSDYNYGIDRFFKKP